MQHEGPWDRDLPSVEQGKSALREHLLRVRSERAPGEIALARDAVRESLLRRARAQGWQRVAAYEALRTEPGSPQLLAALRDTGIAVVVPVLLPDRDLDWHEWEPSEPSGAPPLGVEAIAVVDAILVPALAAARDGTRLGRGGGSYDRALRRAPVGAPLIALLFDGEVVAELPRDPWDIPVTAAMTPTGWHDLG